MIIEKIGIIGGGQLGRMIALKAFHMGFKVCVLSTPNNKTSFDCIAESYVYCDCDDKSIIAFAKSCDVAIIENENIQIDILSIIEQYTRIVPDINIIKTFQNRFLEKDFLSSIGVPVVKNYKCQSLSCVENIPHEAFPIILKSEVFGYDGKMQYRAHNAQDMMDQIKSNTIPECRYIAESMLQDFTEFSVIIASNGSETIHYECVDNIHQDGILHNTFFPSKQSKEIQEQAYHIAYMIADKLDLFGMICIEYFVSNNQIYVNEIAPRVHNSGHWSMDFAFTSQFEQIIRCISGLPLGSTHLTVDSGQMVNLIGANRNDIYKKFANSDKSKIYWYSKASRPGRKVGHINICTS